MKERLLDPEAIALFVREYHEESARREQEEARARRRLERKIALESRRLKRLVEAIASGASTFQQVRETMLEAQTERDRLKEELAARDGERVIALHPSVVDDYRRAVASLNVAIAEVDAPEAREQAMPRIRALIDSITLKPATVGRGVDIEITGRLASMIELATGRSLGERGMIALERVKGIEPSS